jgi:two-component system sensor histidine kinase KdpD
VLTRDLGGEMVELEGESITDAILRFAREHQATSIVMGQSVRGRLDEILRGSIITRIMREARHLDVLVVADADT